MPNSDDRMPPPEIAEELVNQLHNRWLQETLVEVEEHSHPDLVPFRQLPQEKQAERLKEGKNLLKTIIELGYRLLPPEVEEPTSTPISGIERMSVGDLYSLVTRLPGHTPDSVRCAIAQRALNLGEPLLAYETLAHSAESEDPRSRQLLALALARTGDTGKAQEILHALYESGHQDAETLGLLARTHKDLWRLEGASIEPAVSLYLQAYQQAVEFGYPSDQIYTGVNAASTLLFAGREAQARELAHEITKLCQETPPEERDYWSEATLGETALICGDIDSARSHYQAAVAKAPHSYGQYGTTRGQARSLLEAQKLAPNLVDDCFAIPDVFVLDCEGSEGPNLEQLRALSPEPALAYLYLNGEGALVLLERLNELGWGTHVVADVAPAALDAQLQLDGPRIQAGLRGASSTVVANPKGVPSQMVASYYAVLLQRGLGRLRAQGLDSQTRVLSWSGSEFKAATSPPASTDGREIRGLLFADVANFSKLREHQIPAFIERYMGEVAKLLESNPTKPLLKNTWGDALYLVFDEVAEAGRFALDMRDRLLGIDWTSHGLPGDLRIRVALHAGPVFQCRNPVTGRQNYTGSHVTWAARLEPITPPGEVYVSQPFAAAIAAQGEQGMRCTYVGRTRLAKDMGHFATYHLRRS